MGLTLDQSLLNSLISVDQKERSGEVLLTEENLREYRLIDPSRSLGKASVHLQRSVGKPVKKRRSISEVGGRSSSLIIERNARGVGERAHGSRVDVTSGTTTESSARSLSQAESSPGTFGDLGDLDSAKYLSQGDVVVSDIRNFHGPVQCSEKVSFETCLGTGFDYCFICGEILCELGNF